MSQDTKRMFYVAFTRAMNSQYILSYGLAKNPPIQSSYEQIVNALTERDKKNALRAQGIDPDLPVDDYSIGETGSTDDVDQVAQVV
jgi:DNA helicase-2/ATP-dependent DNA helicase PcrA